MRFEAQRIRRLRPEKVYPAWESWTADQKPKISLELIVWLLELIVVSLLWKLIVRTHCGLRPRQYLVVESTPLEILARKYLEGSPATKFYWREGS